MDFKIVWTEPAIENLRQIATYISKNNPAAAVKLGDEIFKRIEVLETFPFVGVVYPRGSTVGTREIIVRNYRIFYRVQEDKKAVEILAVWHGSRREPELGK